MQITIREPGSALTHFIAMILAVFAAVPLLVKSALHGGAYCFIAMCIFMASMILLYGASATYHSVNLSGNALQAFKKMDHMMIFILIAGSYTPVCMITLERGLGYLLLTVIWSIALIGMLFKLFWVNCPKWVSSVLYISMGWIAIFAVVPLYRAMPLSAFLWLLAGGLVYTVGGVIYALKFPIFNARHKNFGTHEIFHLFVMGGSFCHFIFMYFFVA